MAGRKSKVIGVSMKNRGAILPAGHMADAAYWFEGGKFVTSSYYMTALPAWAGAFNAEDRATRYQTADWSAVDAKPAALPFCSMAGAKEVDQTRVRGCESLDATPFANTLLEEFAEKAIENEDLGKHGDTDVLTLSFSANDILGHRVGPDAPEIRDISIRTDETIGKLLDFLDARLGSGATLAVFTADHGIPPSPKVNNARKMPGGWIDPAEIHRAIETALSERFGAANWVFPEFVRHLYRLRVRTREESERHRHPARRRGSSSEDPAYRARLRTGRYAARARTDRPRWPRHGAWLLRPPVGRRDCDAGAILHVRGQDGGVVSGRDLPSHAL